MKRVFAVLFLFLCLGFRTIQAQSDDITLMGSVSPLFYLPNAFQEEVLTSNQEKITVEISSIAAGSDRVLVRFFAGDLPERWKDFLTDENRLYGSYLPTAEIVLEDGRILTPSSASRFSLLEYNNRLITGGLLVFSTSTCPQAFYLNFNQLPFDTSPLSEGFTKAVILTAAVPENNRNSQETDSAFRNGLDFSLSSTAQTNKVTMLQPAVRMEREDEILSKFGWISVSEAESGKRFAVSRGSLYGFNLADDTEFSPAHAYIFAAQHDEHALNVTMDHAYVVRKFSPARSADIDLTGKKQTLILEEDVFSAVVSSADLIPEEDRIRLYIHSGDTEISDISFKFPKIKGPAQPSVKCGIAPENGKFACDIVFNDISFPQTNLSAEIDAVEYRKQGPWTITWIPVPMEEQYTEDFTPEPAEAFPYTYAYPISKEQPPEVQKISDSIEQRTAALMQTPGWIHENYELDYQFREDFRQELIQSDQYSQYRTHYIQENQYLVDSNSQIHEILMVVRDPETHEISSAQWLRPGETLDLIHALRSKTNQQAAFQYNCFDDFRNLAESSAVFLSSEQCPENNDLICMEFYQSLNGLPDSPNSQIISFTIDQRDNFILQKDILYNSGALHLTKTTLLLEKADTLPKDILELMDSIIL